ncbi:hypothetical protein ACJX0J_020514 [Zea mays]
MTLGAGFFLIYHPISHSHNLYIRSRDKEHKSETCNKVGTKSPMNQVSLLFPCPTGHELLPWKLLFDRSIEHLTTTCSIDKLILFFASNKNHHLQVGSAFYYLGQYIHQVILASLT